VAYGGSDPAKTWHTTATRRLQRRATAEPDRDQRRFQSPSTPASSKPRLPQASKKERTKEGWDWRWTPGRPPFGPNSVPVEFDRQDRQEGERLRRSATTCWRPNGTVPVDAIGMIDAIGGDAFGEVPIVREETDVERAAR
jgi:hypothetical protein